MLNNRVNLKVCELKKLRLKQVNLIRNAFQLVESASLFAFVEIRLVCFTLL